MSKYTTEVRYICEVNSGFPTDEMYLHTPDEIIAAARSKIFNFSYPIYETGHKPELETKILKHYYTREIGAETVGLWKLWLNDTLNLIMPKYNKLYEMEALTLNKVLQNIDVETVTERADDFTRTDNLTDSRDHTRTDNLTDASDMTRTDNLARATEDKYSDTPQGTVTNVDNDTYLTDYRSISEADTGTQRNAGSVQHTGTQRDAGTDQHTGTQRNAGTSDTTVTEQGYRGSRTYLELMAEYQDRILNIDMMIVRDLGDLFMKLW